MLVYTAVNINCGRKTHVIDTTNKTTEEIQVIINEYDKTKWIIVTT